jgi:glycosyltransferase involved in cell wall biosynthesis
VLARCLEALAKQGFPPARFEVIVVDDGSTDGTPALVERLTGALPIEVRLVRQPRPRGANAARNRGVREARGDLLVFIDDDVLTPEEWLSSLVSGFLAARLPVGTGPVRLATDGKLPGRHRAEISTYLTEVLEPATGPGGILVPISANMISRRENFLRTEFDETVQAPNEETDWLLRSGLTVAFLPSAWVWHHKREAELRRFRILRLAWRRGGEGGRWTRERLNPSLRGRTEAAGQALTTAARAFAHGLLRVCWGGIAIGTSETSRALALLGLTRRSGLPKEQP